MQELLPSAAPTPSARRAPPPPVHTARTYWTVGVLLAVIWSLWRAGFFTRDFTSEIYNARGLHQIQRFFAASLHPQLDLEFLRLTLDSTLITLAFAVCGAVCSLLSGFLLGILSSEVWWRSLLPRQPQWAHAGWLCMRTLIAIPRAVHEIVWGLIFVNLIGLDPLTAICAIAVPFGAIIAKVYGEILDEMPRQPYMALIHSGVSAHKAMLYTLLPQSMRDLLSYGFYRFECSIRAAAVLGIIGAGGLGYQIFVSLKTLKYEQLWTFFYALILLNGLFDYWSGHVRRHLGGRIRHADLPQSQTLHSPNTNQGSMSHASTSPARSDAFVQRSLLAFALLVPFSFWYVAPDITKLGSSRFVQQLHYIAATSVPPDFTMLSPIQWLEHTSITLAMSILATAMAAIVGLGLSFLAADNFLLPGGIIDMGHNSSTLHRLVSTAILVATRLLLLVARAIPPPIWALVFLFGLFPGILPGALALGLYTTGVLGRLMAEVTENMDERPLFGLRAVGAGPIKVIFYGLLPATVPRFIAYSLYRWEENVRATVVIGLVGAGGLGRLLVEKLSQFDNQGVVATLAIFAVLTFAVDLLSNRARAAYR